MPTTLITGTGTGIGRATAAELARAGHDVIATMRGPERSGALQDLAASEKLSIAIIPLDVDSDESVRRAIAEATRAKGPIDVLVNNAGIGQGSAVEDTSLGQFRQTMETNFFGALRCIKAVLPSMRERRRGCIVNVTSVAGRIAMTPQAAYAASKSALEAASEALAQEVRPFGIKVALVEPGVIATPIFNKLDTLPETLYPGPRRMHALFAASLSARQVPPELVGEKIREIVERDGPITLRHPVGPDAEPFLRWRLAFTDEEWVAFGAIEDDDAWSARIQQDLGLDVRPYLGRTASGIVADEC